MQTIYRWKLKSLLRFLPIGISIGLFVTTLDLMVLLIFKNNLTTETLFVFWFMSIAAIFFTLGALIILSLPLIEGLFGYIKISPEGFEHRRWPFTSNEFDWGNLESIRRGKINDHFPFYRGELEYGSLLIKRNKLGFEFKSKGGTLGSANYYVVSLSEFQEWDDGSLVANLKLYAPHLTVEDDVAH